MRPAMLVYPTTPELLELWHDGSVDMEQLAIPGIPQDTGYKEGRFPP